MITSDSPHRLPFGNHSKPTMLCHRSTLVYEELWQVSRYGSNIRHFDNVRAHKELKRRLIPARNASLDVAFVPSQQYMYVDVLLHPEDILGPIDVESRLTSRLDNFSHSIIQRDLIAFLPHHHLESFIIFEHGKNNAMDTFFCWHVKQRKKLTLCQQASNFKFSHRDILLPIEVEHSEIIAKQIDSGIHGKLLEDSMNYSEHL